jgi:hypothetical protein
MLCFFPFKMSVPVDRTDLTIRSEKCAWMDTSCTAGKAKMTFP